MAVQAPAYMEPGGELQVAQLDAQRQMKLADMLRQQSAAPMQGQMAGRVYVGPSWTQGLSKMLQGYVSGNMEDKAYEGLKTAQGTYDTKNKELLASFLAEPDEQKRLSIASQAPDNKLMQAYLANAITPSKVTHWDKDAQGNIITGNDKGQIKQTNVQGWIPPMHIGTGDQELLVRPTDSKVVGSFTKKATPGELLTDARANATDESVPELSPQALENAAARYNIDGTLPAVGIGKAGSKLRAGILNTAGEQASTSGQTPDEQRITHIGNKANSVALNKLTAQRAMVGAFEKTFNLNADMALEGSKKIDSTGVPIVNKWLNAGKRAVTGDKDLSGYDTVIKAVVNEYSKIVSGSMGNTAVAEGEIKKMTELLSAAQTPEQVEAVIGMMKAETQNRMHGFDAEHEELTNRMKRKPTTNPAAATLPKGLTQADIDTNVKKYGVTPQAVIDAYNKQNGGGQ